MAEEEKKPSSTIPALRTLKTDAVSFSSDKKISFVQAAASELARRQERGRAAERGEAAKKVFVIALAGIAGVLEELRAGFLLSGKVECQLIPLYRLLLREQPLLLLWTQIQCR